MILLEVPHVRFLDDDDDDDAGRVPGVRSRSCWWRGRRTVNSQVKEGKNMCRCWSV